jgi:hypothetical protein
MPSRTAIATAAVLAGLGGLATAALTSRPDGGAPTAAATTPAPGGRTTTEVHTIVRVRRDLPPAQPRPATAAAPPLVAQQAPVVQPLRTRASGSGGADRGDDGAEPEEREGGEHDD